MGGGCVRFVTLVLVAAIVQFAACATARAADPFDLTVPALAAPPSMNGTLDDTWKMAAPIDVSYDFTFRRPGETTTAYVAVDESALDVAFVVKQRAAITATQATNGAGVLTDDHVTVALWPQGTQGFGYDFSATPRGVRYQTSSENTAYAPEWTAVSTRTPDGYIVTMRIPFNVIRSGGSTTWSAQFERTSIATGNTQVWEQAAAQSGPEQPAFAGTLRGVAAGRQTAASRPRPRVQVYGLGEIASPAIGGSTSRVGADIALPVTATSSLLATLHPDYSNVEVDQQTIAPAAFQRQFNEVRPFFTQTAQNFNQHTACLNCPQTLYTPAIPTFGQGYAYEGTQGPLQFAAFDAIGFERHDIAQALTYGVSNAKRSYAVNLQNVEVAVPGLRDVTTTIDAGYTDQPSHLFGYVNSGTDRGTLVTHPGLGNYFEYGAGYNTQTTTSIVDLQRIGAQFSPLDGFVQQTDINGYALDYSHTANFTPHSYIRSVNLMLYYSRYADRFGRIAQDNVEELLTFNTRNLFSLQLTGNATGIRTVLDEFLPFNTSGFQFAYKSTTATPTSITYYEGAYYHGQLTNWAPTTTLRAGTRGLFTLGFNRVAYAPTVSLDPPATQLLEHVSFDYQFSPNASFDVGLRRIIGPNLPNAFQVPDLATSPSPFLGQVNGPLPFDNVNASNVSFAFHFLRAQNEFYIVYGNPNNLTTNPGFVVKWIHYIGAQKGT